MTGTGESSTQAITLKPGTYNVEVNYEGASEFHRFAVEIANIENPDVVPKPNRGLKAGIIFSELLDEEEAPSGFSGSKSVRFEEPGPYVSDVDAEGPWQLTIR